MARTPEEPGCLPDLPVPGRLRPTVRDVTSPVARAAALAGRARRLPGPQVRRDRGAVRGLAADRPAGPAAFRWADDESPGVRGPIARRADLGRAGSHPDPGVRPFSSGGRR